MKLVFVLNRGLVITLYAIGGINLEIKLTRRPPITQQSADKGSG